jgi:hypothetical protein
MNNKYKGRPTFKCFIEDGGDCKKVTRENYIWKSIMSSLKSKVFFLQFCDVDKWQSSVRMIQFNLAIKNISFKKM